MAAVVPEPTGPTRGNPPLEIICCLIPGQLRDETMQALAEHAYPQGVRINYVALSDDPHAYGRTLAMHWRDALVSRYALAIVEPDIVVRPDVIDTFLNCPHPYCAYPYELLTDIMPALGCTRFRHEFIARYPNIFDRVVRKRIGFRQVDVTVQRAILVREYGEQPHVHLPKVEHLNEAKALRPDANPEPLMTLPAW